MKPFASPEKRDFTVDDARKFVAENDDFGFEMKVAAEIRNTLRVDVFHGGTYSDPVAGKPRQFDIRFRVRDERKILYFAVECKNIDPAHPVVICGRNSEAKENFHDVIVSRGSVKGACASIRKAEACRYRAHEFVDKSVLKPDMKGRSNDSEIYDRWSQALASAHDLVMEAANSASGFEFPSFGAVFAWVVVPDETLWTVTYNGDGQIVGDPKVANHCRYFVGHEYVVPRANEKVCVSHIDFVTFSGLRQKLESLHSSAVDWDDWIPEKIRSSYRGG